MIKGEIALIIQNNMAAMTIYRQGNIVHRLASKAMERLSSGFRINTAADDAAGLAISEKMRGQIRGMRRAQRNVGEGVDLLRTMDDGLNTIQEMMLRQRELMVYAANDTNNSLDRGMIQIEIDQLQEEIGEVADQCRFNGIPLLNVSGDPTKGTGTTRTEIRQVPVYRTESVPAGPDGDVIQVTLASPPVGSNGEFDFYATNSSGGTESQLLYMYRFAPTTSHPTLRVNGVRYDLWDGFALDSATTHNAGIWTTTFGLRRDGLDLTVKQHVSIVDNPDDIGGQSYKIDYELINNNAASPVTFDFMHHLDIQLGHNDRAPVEVDGTVLSTAQIYDGAAIPGTINIYDNVEDPYIRGVIITNSTSGLSFGANSEPDRVNVGEFAWVEESFGSDSSSRLESPSVLHEYEDTGYAVVWSGRATDGNNPYTMTTYYGVRNPSEEIMGEIGWTEVEVFDHYEEVAVTIREGQTDGPAKPLWIQSGANAQEGIFVDRYDCRPEVLYRGVFDAEFTVNINGVSQAVRISKLEVGSHQKASASLGALDAVFNRVISYRSAAGAQYNRLEFKFANLGVAEENLASAESRIRDADMAKEMTGLTRLNLLTQVSQAMLAQANQSPETVLQLLR